MTTDSAKSEERLASLLRSPKRRKFVIAYVENGGNATSAAEVAGFAVPNVEGCRLLKDASVVEAIERHANIVSNVAGESRDTVLARIRNRANVDPRDYFEIHETASENAEGEITITRHETLKNVTSLTKAQAQCIKKITWNTQGFPSIEFHDPSAADRDLARLMGLEPKENEVLSPEDAANLIAAAMGRMDELDHSAASSE